MATAVVGSRWSARKDHYCDHCVGVLSHRCFFNSPDNSFERPFPSDAAVFASTFLTLRMPGMIVLTSGLDKINRNASSGMDIPEGMSGFNLFARSTLAFKFS